MYIVVGIGFIGLMGSWGMIRRTGWRATTLHVADGARELRGSTPVLEYWSMFGLIPSLSEGIHSSLASLDE